MWYIIRKPGNIDEEKVCEKCRAAIPKQLAPEIFVPKYEDMKKRQGSWEIELDILYPGYIFLDSESPKELLNYLEKIPIDIDNHSCGEYNVTNL